MCGARRLRGEMGCLGNFCLGADLAAGCLAHLRNQLGVGLLDFLARERVVVGAVRELSLIHI